LAACSGEMPLAQDTINNAAEIMTNDRIILLMVKNFQV
jgi:hypothetical protein